MTRVVMVAGTYRPEHCGVAHYTERLRAALDKHGISSVVLTTREAAREAGDSGVRGAVGGGGERRSYYRSSGRLYGLNTRGRM